MKKRRQEKNIEEKERKTPIEEGEKKKEKKEGKEKKKSHFFLKILFLFIIIAFIGIYYMRFIETKMLFVKEIKIEDTNIPEGFSGLKVVHFSDLHYRMSTEEEDLKKIVHKINALKPDVLVFTGDLLDHTISYQKEDYDFLMEQFKKMDATIAKYYIKGNHDYFTDQVDIILQNAEFTSLNNKSDVIYANEYEKIQFLGTGSSLENDFQKEEAMSNIENGLYTILLLHEPDNLLEMDHSSISLALAGHSHHHQIHIPYLCEAFTVEGAKTYHDSFYQVQNTSLYINGGIGTSIYPFRLFAPPTINLYRLVRSK